MPSVTELAILIYGYHRGWRSSRKLQHAIEENTAMRYLVAEQKRKARLRLTEKAVVPEKCKDKTADKNRGKIMQSYNVQVASRLL